MVGLNHELASELLWREFPSDTRGTRTSAASGTRGTRADAAAAADRSGARRPGSASHFGARRARRAADPRRAAAPLPRRADLRRSRRKTATALGTEEKLPLFRGRIDPDITFLGFDLTEARRADARRLVLRDPGAADRAAVRARRRRARARSTAGTTSPGADVRTAPGAQRRRSPTSPPARGARRAAWAFNAAHMAAILRQRPVRIAFHADSRCCRREDARARSRRSSERCLADVLPIALLPVQVQTRYVTRGTPQLLVRVYPDELHVDDHEPAPDRRRGARGGGATGSSSGRRRATRRRERARGTQLAERFGARRAAWVARRLRPTEPRGRPGDAAGVPGRRRRCAPRDDPPARARRATPARPLGRDRLPRGERVLLEAGEPIPDDAPGRPGADEPPPPRRGELPLDAGMRWLVDFAEAEKVGMGIRVALTESSRPRPLLVLGVKAVARRPPPRRRALEALLDAHRYTRGLAFLAPGTPTNNTADAAPAAPRATRAASSSRCAPPRIATSRLRRRRAALGIRRGRARRSWRARRAGGPDARRLQTALWPVTGGYFLDQMMRRAGLPATPRSPPRAALRRPRARARPAAGRCASAASRTACCP